MSANSGNSKSALHAITLLFAVTISFLSIAGCSKLANTSDFIGEDLYVFEGLSKLVKVGDGTYMLSWKQVPANDVSYLIYSRSAAGEYDFSTPVKSVKEVSFQTADLSFKGDQCFVVRFQAPSVDADTNTAEQCTGQDPYSFSGLKSLKSNGDGTYTVSWQQAPGSETMYSIYSRRSDGGEYDFNSAAATIKETQWKSDDLSFVGNTCFIVRFSNPNAEADKNTNEICTKSSAISFSGLDKIEVANDGSLVLRWTRLPQPNIAYSIYRTSTSGTYDFTTNPWKSVVDVSDFSVATYPLDQHFCYVVRFVKASAPEDTNTKEICPSLAYVSDFAGIAGVTSPNTGTAVISWAAPSSGASDIAGYLVYLGSGFVDLKGSTNASATSVTIANLPVDQTLTFGVRTVDSHGREDSNAITKNVTIINNATPTFNGLTSATQVTGQKSVTLSWVAADGVISQYRVYYGLGASGTSPAVSYTTPLTTTNGSTLSALVSGLGDDLTYCFDVRAVSSGGQESTTANAKCVTLPDMGAPSFAGITGAQFASGGAQISWTSSADQVTSYYVYYAQGSSINFSTAQFQIVSNPAPPTAQKNSATLYGLADSTTYTFAVRAIDKNAVADSNTASRTVTAGDLTPPVFLGVTTLTAVDETHLSLTFNRSTESDVDHYSIRLRKTTDGGDFSEVMTVPQPSGSPATVTTNVASLLPATSYDVLVKAVDTSGNESTNTAATTRATLDLTAPTFSGISSVGLDPADQSKVKVTWSAANDASGVLGYRVYYATSTLSGCTSSLVWTASYPHSFSGCSAAVSMSTLVTSATSISFSGLTEGSTYYFIVHAIDNSNSNNEDNNTVQSAFNVPYYTPPSPPSGVAIAGGNGPSANNSITVTGTADTGNTVKIYVNGVFSTQQVLNSGTSFSIPVTLSTTPGTYAITASQVNLSSVEGNPSTPVNYVLQNQAPTATLSGQPCSPTNCYTNANALSVAVAGANVVTYQYALLFNVSTACASVGYNGVWTAVATAISNSLSGTGDGTYRLCVIGKDAAGNAQAAANATQFDFTRATAPPAAPSVASFKDPITNSTTESYNGTVTVTVGTVTGASEYCAKGGSSTPSQPSSNDTCWSTSTTLNAVLSGAGGTTTANTIYAWSQDAAGNVSSSPSNSSTTISYVNICSSGTLADTCTISTTRTLAAGGATIGGTGNILMTANGRLNGAANERSTITLNGNFTMQSGAIVNANVTLTAANFSNAGGVFKADGLGYPGTAAAQGNGLGGGGYSASYGGGGGGYGGMGGYGFSNSTYISPAVARGAVNGSASAPTFFGSSGGGTSSIAGGAGGGALKFVISGTFTNDGTVSANGLGNASTGGGGGSGGSIWLIAGSVAGTGSLQASGGNGYGCNGPGGGGRIAVTSSNVYLGTFNVAGSGSSPGCNVAPKADPGTIYTSYTSICDSGTLSDTCVVSSNITLGDNYSIAGTGNLTLSGSISSYKYLGTISIAMGGDVVIQANATIRANISSLTAANLRIDANGSIDASSYGYTPAYLTSYAYPSVTTGVAGSTINGFSTSIYATGGGGHGGRGGNTQRNYGTIANLTGGGIYGSNTAPTSYGSPGGDTSNSGSYYFPFGGIGGGAVSINVTGTATINGSITVNGGNGSSHPTAGSTGGGAGGSIYLVAPTIAGTGTLTAAGGAGGTTGLANSNSGGGGGGRIALTATNKFSGTISVAGGAGGGSGAGDGEPGYASFTNPDNYCTTGDLSTTCYISGAFRFDSGETLSGAAFVLQNGAQLATNATERFTLTATADVTLQGGSLISGNPTINAANFTLANGASISADGLGYAPTCGTGNAYQASSAGLTGYGTSNGGSSGGAHGGLGGAGQSVSAIAPSATYDSASAPIQFGSAGGSYDCNNTYGGGPGGGAIKLNITGTTQIEGLLLARGLPGLSTSPRSGGGGAGGSIYILTNIFAGAGVLSADGGDGGPVAYMGGKGGGGRISVVNNSNTFTGTETANTGTAGNGGANGTVQ